MTHDPNEPTTSRYPMSHPQFPPVDEQVLKALEARFRDSIPSTLVSEGELGRLVGQQEVIRFLRFTFNEQTNPQPSTED